jgi:mannose-6-phosphate isomerase-like protein (cupin superfamily)
VITGTASVETGGDVTDVAAGSAFLLDTGEAHIIHNRSAEPLSVFSTYWMPLKAAGQAGREETP